MIIIKLSDSVSSIEKKLAKIKFVKYQYPLSIKRIKILEHVTRLCIKIAAVRCYFDSFKMYMKPRSTEEASRLLRVMRQDVRLRRMEVTCFWCPCRTATYVT